MRNGLYGSKRSWITCSRRWPWCDLCGRQEGFWDCGSRTRCATFGFTTGITELGRQATLAALGRAGAAERKHCPGQGACRRGLLSAGSAGRYDEANEHLVEALSIARENWRPQACRYDAHDSRVSRPRPRSRAASALAPSGKSRLPRRANLGDSMLVARALNGMGEVYRVAGKSSRRRSRSMRSRLALGREQEKMSS